MPSDPSDSALPPRASAWAERAPVWVVWQVAENETGQKREEFYQRTRDPYRSSIRIPWFIRSTDPIVAFSSFVSWWVTHESLPLGFDRQSPSAVRVWLIALDDEMEGAWEWYLAECRARRVAAEEKVFGGASSKAIEIVRGLLPEGSAEIVNRLPQTILDVHRLIRRELLPLVDRVHGHVESGAWGKPAPSDQRTIGNRSDSPVGGTRAMTGSVPGQALGESAKPTEEPLTDRERTLLAILAELGTGKGLVGKELIAELEKQGELGITQSSLTSRLIPGLRNEKNWEIPNPRGSRGYHLTEKDRARFRRLGEVT